MENNIYKYENLIMDINELKKTHPQIPIYSIGKSVGGKELCAIKIGNGSRKVFLNGCHHGMEWLTAKILIEFAKRISCEPSDMSATVYIVPMVNPDGVEISASVDGWQANANGVDLNHNYDALWELSKQTELSYGIAEPGATRFGGDFPESEPETRAVANFTRQNKFDAAFALHSQGRVIYYDFCGIVPSGTEDYLKRFEQVSNYVRDIPDGIASYGGFKDWFIKKFKKPAFTIEVGKGKNPLPLSDFDKVYSEILPILYEAIK